MEYYFEFEGGLGDILHRCFERGEYRRLSLLKPGDSARITVFSVNPFAHEIFCWHPKRDQVHVTQLPHWGPHAEYAEKRKEHNLPPRSRVDHLPGTAEPVEFFPSPSDEVALTSLRGRRYVVIAASAGLPERTIPQEIVTSIANSLLQRGLFVVRIGRNYVDQRSKSRFEPELPSNDGVIDVVDRLSVPGTAIALQQSVGLVCSHSAMSLLGWHLWKPQLLLYPQSVYDRCILAKRDQYTMFGASRPSTQHGRFGDFSESMLDKFCSSFSHLCDSVIDQPRHFVGQRLNIGCGMDYRCGFINIDACAALPRIDLVVQVGTESLLKHFRLGSVEYILANDFIEHHPRWEAIRIMAEFHALLRSGSCLEMRVPDAAFIMSSSVLSVEQKLNRLFGGQDVPQGRNPIMEESRKRHPEWFSHKFGWTQASMSTELRRVGFSEVKCRSDRWNFVVTAWK